MIFEYTSIHESLEFSAFAYKDASLSSGSIVFGIEDYNGLGARAIQTIPITTAYEVEVSGSLDLTTLSLVEGRIYTTFYDRQIVSSGSFAGHVPSMYFERPLLSTTLSDVVAGTSGSIGSQSLDTVCQTGNTTNLDINCGNLVAAKNMFCNLGGTGTASITFDSILGDQLTNDGVNFAMDNFLVIPVSGSVFETALIYNNAQVGGNLEVDGSLVSNGLLSTTSDTIYTRVSGPSNADQYHYFYHGNAIGAYMWWDSSEELFGFNKPVKKITTRVTTTYTILIGDDTIFCDTDGGAFTVTLPAGSDGQTFRIINCGTSGNDLTIAPNGAELLTGVNASKTASDGTVIILTYETTEGWY